MTGSTFANLCDKDPMPPSVHNKTKLDITVPTDHHVLFGEWTPVCWTFRMYVCDCMLFIISQCGPFNWMGWAWTPLGFSFPEGAFGVYVVQGMWNIYIDIYFFLWAKMTVIGSIQEWVQMMTPLWKKKHQIKEEGKSKGNNSNNNNNIHNIKGKVGPHRWCCLNAPYGGPWSTLQE